MKPEFYIDLSRGRQAEVLVAEAFRMMGFSVLDVSKDPAFWNKDIDLIITDHDGQDHYFEVKADWNMNQTSNVVLELSNQSCGNGWYRTSEATHFAFCDMRNRICYIARSAELHKYTDNNSDLPHVWLRNCECLLVNVNDCNVFQKIRI